MADIRSVAIFGASGNIGEVIVPALLAAGLDVTAVTREGSNTTFPSGVKVVTANYTSVASLTSILQNIDAAVSLLGPQGVQHHHRMIDAAVAAGVKYFIPSEFGFDWMDPGVFPLLPLFARKHSAIEYLKTKEKNGLSWTMIITGLWFDWGLPFNMFDVDLKARKATLWDGGNTVFRATNVQDIATAVTCLLTNPSARTVAENTSVYISSVETTQNEILIAAEEVTGSKFEVESVDSETVFKDVESKTARGDLSAIKTLLKAIALSKRGLSAFGEKADAGNELLLDDTSGKESVKETVKRVVEGRGPQGKWVTQI